MLLDKGSGQFNETQTAQQGIVITDTALVISLLQASFTAKQAYSGTQRIAYSTNRQGAADCVSTHGYSYTFIAAAEPNTAVTKYLSLLQQAVS